MEGIWIGTSGWVYKHWAETFYPQEWPKSRQFEFYVTQFPTVEINATFYRLPSENMAEGWRKKSPNGFVFAVKGSRYITHLKKLVEAEEGLKNYFDRLAALRERTGPILWQLPPWLKKDPERLENFLKKLPKKYWHAVEFRHPSWIDDEIFQILRSHNAACVWLSSQRMPLDFTVTADFVYARFHGLDNGAAHDYSESELKPWAEELKKMDHEGKPAFVYFNNDWNTRAPLNAQLLMQMVGDAAVQPFAEPENLLRKPPRPRKRPDARLDEPRSKRLRENFIRPREVSEIKKFHFKKVKI